MAAWLQELSGLPVAASTETELQAQLKSGVVLCQAANRMGAGITTISKSDERFEQISNIDKFLEFLKTTCAADRDLFVEIVATDLHDNKDTRQLMNGLNNLGRALHHVPGYSGPTVCQAKRFFERIPRAVWHGSGEFPSRKKSDDGDGPWHGEKCDRMRVVVCSARNVMAKTLFGSSSDCQCILKFGSRECSTAVVKGTLQPCWNVAFYFNYDTSNAHHDHLHVEVIHAGLLGPKLLGCVDVKMNTLDDCPDRCVIKSFELQPGPESKNQSRSRGEIDLSILRYPARFHPTSTTPNTLPDLLIPETDTRITLTDYLFD
jgi:hypothetical protein